MGAFAGSRDQRAAFEVVGERTAPFATDYRLGLVSLPEAAEQTAQVAIHAPADVGLSIQDVGVTPLEVELADRDATARAAFSYLPSHTPSSVTLVRDPGALVPPAAALVWRRIVESRYDIDGNGLHRAIFHIRNAGRGDVVVTSPSGVAFNAPMA